MTVQPMFGSRPASAALALRCRCLWIGRRLCCNLLGMVDGFAGAFLCGCQAVAAVVIAASAVAARRRRRVARSVLCLLFFVGAVLEAV